MFFYPKRTIFFTLLRPSTKETENDHGRKIQRQKKKKKKEGKKERWYNATTFYWQFCFGFKNP